MNLHSEPILSNDRITFRIWQTHLTLPGVGCSRRVSNSSRTALPKTRNLPEVSFGFMCTKSSLMNKANPLKYSASLCIRLFRSSWIILHLRWEFGKIWFMHISIQHWIFYHHLLKRVDRKSGEVEPEKRSPRVIELQSLAPLYRKLGSRIAFKRNLRDQYILKRINKCKEQ